MERNKLLPFSFLGKTGKVISLVGAGGKTTWLYRMASFYSARGVRVFVTTTTYMMEPEEKYRAHNIEEAERIWAEGRYVVAGKSAQGGKITKLDQGELEEYEKRSQVVLIEADGAKRMPCKVPADHEPVILPECDVVVGVMGMDSLGKPLEEVCFRVEYAEKLLKKRRDEILTVEDLEKILVSEQGTRKDTKGREYCVILNKCNDRKRREAAEKIAEYLKKEGICSVAIV